MTCQVCGVELTVGLWPWCPHECASVSVIDDTLEGGARFFETMGDQPVWVASKSQWKREVIQRGLVHVDKHDTHFYDRRKREHAERLKDTGADR